MFCGKVERETEKYFRFSENSNLQMYVSQTRPPKLSETLANRYIHTQESPSGWHLMPKTQISDGHWRLSWSASTKNCTLTLIKQTAPQSPQELKHAHQGATGTTQQLEIKFSTSTPQYPTATRVDRETGGRVITRSTKLVSPLVVSYHYQLQHFFLRSVSLGFVTCKTSLFPGFSFFSPAAGIFWRLIISV